LSLFADGIALAVVAPAADEGDAPLPDTVFALGAITSVSARVDLSAESIKALLVLWTLRVSEAAGALFTDAVAAEFVVGAVVVTSAGGEGLASARVASLPIWAAFLPDTLALGGATDIFADLAAAALSIIAATLSTDTLVTRLVDGVWAVPINHASRDTEASVTRPTIKGTIGVGVAVERRSTKAVVAKSVLSATVGVTIALSFSADVCIADLLRRAVQVVATLATVVGVIHGVVEWIVVCVGGVFDALSLDADSRASAVRVSAAAGDGGIVAA
jgi:hypothetical protein